MKADVHCETYACAIGENVPYLDVSAVLSPDGHTVTLFVVNRSLCDSVQCQFHLTEQAKLVRHISMAGFAPDAVNTADSAPVCPKELPVDSDSGVVLPEASWNMLQFSL